MRRNWEPTMTKPIRPSRYPGVVTIAETTPPTAAAAILSRRVMCALVAPMSRDGTAT
jgi:hypothetical protein